MLEAMKWQRQRPWSIGVGGRRVQADTLDIRRDAEDPVVIEPQKQSAVELTIEPRIRPVGSGSVRRLLPYRTRRMVGPFTFLDNMGPEELGPGEEVNVNAHPTSAGKRFPHFALAQSRLC